MPLNTFLQSSTPSDVVFKYCKLFGMPSLPGGGGYCKLEEDPFKITMINSIAPSQSINVYREKKLRTEVRPHPDTVNAASAGVFSVGKVAG